MNHTTISICCNDDWNCLWREDICSAILSCGKSDKLFGVEQLEELLHCHSENAHSKNPKLIGEDIIC